MALFKIFKGSSTALGATSATKAANEGFAYFTPDNGKFYIDTETSTTAVVGVNRIPLNAYHADITDTAVFATDSLFSVWASSAMYAKTASYALCAASATTVKQNASNTTSADYRILLSTSGTDNAETGSLNKSSNLQYNPKNNKLQTGNLKLTGELDVSGNTYLHNQTNADSIVADSLVVNGSAVFNNGIIGTATNAVTSGNALHAQTAYYASMATTAWYSGTAEWALDARHSNSANYSACSAYAIQAGSAGFATCAYYASSATYATKAAQDAAGNSITGTYVHKAGDTMSGNLLGNGAISLGSTANPFHNIVLGGNVTASMASDSTNPRITFQEATGTQQVHLVYTDWDNYRAPAGLKVVGGASANPSWFEVEGKTYAKALNNLITGTGIAGKDAGSGDNRYQPAKWTFNTGQNAVNGDIYIIKLPVAGHDYGVFMSVDNGTNYYPVIRNGTDRLTTHYANGQMIQVVFDSSGSASNMFALDGGTSRITVSGGAFRVINQYDSGNTISQIRHENGRVYAGSTGVNPYSLVCLDSANKFSMLVANSTNAGIGTSKTINTSGKYKLPAVIYWYSANNTASANALVPSTYNIFSAYPTVDTRYSHNHTTTFTTNSPLYIECTIDSNGYWSPTTTCITQTLTSGKYYIYLGQTYSTEYQLTLTPFHPVYYYDGTNLTDYTRQVISLWKSGSAGYAASAAQATYSASSNYSQSALTSSYAVTALRAISSGSAEYSASAAEATHSASAAFASAATCAANATKAGSAGYAASALTSSYSVTALRAISSGSAGYAASAAQATHSASSDYATYAWLLANKGGSGVSAYHGLWAHGKAGAYDKTLTAVWSQSWKIKDAYYVPSSGTTSTLTDSGDMVIWLSQSTTSNGLAVNMILDGKIYAGTGFEGRLYGMASSANWANYAGTANWAKLADTAKFATTAIAATIAAKLSTTNTLKHFWRGDNTWSNEYMGNIYQGMAFTNGTDSGLYYKVASFSQNVTDAQINTLLTLYVSSYYSPQGKGILELSCRWEKNATSPAWLYNRWLTADTRINKDYFIATWSCDNSKNVVLNLYVKITGSWADYNFVRMAEHNWGSAETRWTLYKVSGTNGVATISDNETQVVSVFDTIRNTAQNANYAGTATHAKGAYTAIYSSSASWANLSGTAGFATSALNAAHAQTAHYASSANWSTTAQYSGTAGRALWATTAYYTGTAARALLATTSLYAVTAAQSIKVYQNAANTNNTAYRILLSGTATDNAETTSLNKASNLQYNPSTNKLSTGNIKLAGELDVTGNAYLRNQTTIDSLTAGSLLVNGNANFVQSPTAPTPANGDNSTKVATTAFVKTSVAGLSGAMHFIGKATVVITDGSTTDPVISGYSTKTAGDVIIDKDNVYEYVWTKEGKWERLGQDSPKIAQTAVNTGTTATNKWVAYISQNENGNITATMATLVTTGLWSGSANYAGTATAAIKLAAARTLWGQSFDGTANVTGNISSAGHITSLTDSTYDIGSSSNHWRYGYFDELAISNDTGFTSSSSGKSGTWLKAGAIELVGGGPYIDFHYNNSTADYTSRVYSGAAGRINITSNTTPATATFNSRPATPGLNVDYGIYSNNDILTPTSFVNVRNAAGGGFILFNDNIEYGRLYIDTVGKAPTAVANTTTTYTGAVCGYASLILGNNRVNANSSSGVANNARGRIYLYESNTSRAVFYGTYWDGGGNSTYQMVGQTSSVSGTQAWTILALGNGASIASTAAHSQGILRLYSNGTKYIDIRNNNQSNNRVVYFQAYDSDQYIIHAGSATAVGSATQPVFIAANGRVTACTAQFAGQASCAVYAATAGWANRAGQDAAGNSITGTYVHKAGDTMTGTLYVNVTTDTGSTSDTGAIIVGNKAGENIAIDSNEIMARNNKVASTLYLNYDGGLVNIGSGGLVINSLSASQAVVTDANKKLVSRGIHDNRAAGALGWTSSSTDITLVTTNTIAYWNGYYSGTSSNLKYSANGEIMGLSTAQTVSGTKTFSAIQKFTNTTDSSHSTDTAAAVSVSGGLSVAKKVSAKEVRIDNNQTSKGVSMQYDESLEVLNFVFS